VPEGITVNDLLVSVDISHDDVGHLQVVLTAPSGTSVRLHDHTGGNTQDLVTTYDTETLPDGPGSLDDFNGEPAEGLWVLNVLDTGTTASGQINSWSLQIVSSLVTTCSPVPCRVTADLTATPGTICEGESSTLSAAGSFANGSDCSGTLEFQFRDSSVIQAWSADADLAVAPLTSTTYTVQARDPVLGTADSATAPLTVLPAPVVAVTQNPTPMCLEIGALDLDAGSGFSGHEWRDELQAVVGTSQVLPLDAAACGRSYTVTVTGVNGCADSASHVVDCLACTPPEVSPPGSPVPLRFGVDAGGTLEFELLAETGLAYHLYHADSMAAILAGDWTHKFCDLESGTAGSWSQEAPDTVRWTPVFPGLLFEGFWVVVAERYGFESSFGTMAGSLPRPPDDDGLGSQGSFDCP
jgi:subtilisin-like proprotein convertase family protein